jgi:hypothetical protein
VAFLIRRIRADDGQQLKDLRLGALADAPDAFAIPYAVEAAMPDERGMTLRLVAHLVLRMGHSSLRWMAEWSLWREFSEVARVTIPSWYRCGPLRRRVAEELPGP